MREGEEDDPRCTRGGCVRSSEVRLVERGEGVVGGGRGWWIGGREWGRGARGEAGAGVLGWGEAGAGVHGGKGGRAGGVLK